MVDIIFVHTFVHMEAKSHQRKEVELHNEIIAKLQQLADKKKYKLKPFMESVLIKEANKAKIIYEKK